MQTDNKQRESQGIYSALWLKHKVPGWKWCFYKVLISIMTTIKLNLAQIVKILTTKSWKVQTLKHQ